MEYILQLNSRLHYLSVFKKHLSSALNNLLKLPVSPEVNRQLD